MDKNHLDRRSLVLVFLAAVIVRLALMVMLQTWEFKSDWAFGHEMGTLGRSLAQGKGFIHDGPSPTAAFPPVYPLIVAGFFSVFGIYSKSAAVALFFFQSLCAGATAVLLAAIGTHLWNRRLGLIAGCIWAFYPTSFFYSIIRVWYCELAMMLLAGAVLIAVTARPPARFSMSAAFGALSGLIILTDSTMAIYLALLLLWMLFKQGARNIRLILLLLTGGITVGAVVSPWAVHNWLVLGSPQIVKSNLGQALYLGNNPLAQGKTNKVERRQAYTALPQEELNFYNTQPELVRDRYFREKAVEWIRQNPARFLELTAHRIWSFWVINPTLGDDSWWRLTYYGPLLLLAAYGIWINLSRLWQLTPLWMFMLVQPLPYYFTHVSAGRYGYPIELFIVALAALPVGIWIQRGAVLLSSWSRSIPVVNSSDRRT